MLFNGVFSNEYYSHQTVGYSGIMTRQVWTVETTESNKSLQVFAKPELVDF